jgi:carbon-monoxide dehydrogenase medium subunit
MPPNPPVAIYPRAKHGTFWLFYVNFVKAGTKMENSFQPKEYFCPSDRDEALDILSKFGRRARVIAGGTDLLSQKPLGVDCLLDIGGLGLDYVEKEGEVVRIGAATTLNSMGESPYLLSGPFQALSEAINRHSTSTIRNRATVGGNLCNGSPCADLALPLLLMDSTLLASGLEGEREIPIDSFFRGANYNALYQGEILLEIRIPPCSEKAGTAFHKLRRQATSIDMAVVNVATLINCEKGACQDARIALGSVGPIPFRARETESLLIGEELQEEIIEKAARNAAGEARPIDDIRATALYRKRMVEVLVRRSLKNSLERCGL